MGAATGCDTVTGVAVEAEHVEHMPAAQQLGSESVERGASESDSDGRLTESCVSQSPNASLALIPATAFVTIPQSSSTRAIHLVAFELSNDCQPKPERLIF